jgi:hypothetical protein
MTEPAHPANGRPVLTEILDEFVEFTDTAIQHTTEPVAPAQASAPGVELVERVDELLEWTGTPIAPAPADGPAAPQPTTRPEPTA